MIVRPRAVQPSVLAPIVVGLHYADVPAEITETTALGIAWANPDDHTQLFMLGGVPVNFTVRTGLWLPWARSGELVTTRTVFGFQPLTDTDFQPRSAYVLPDGKTWGDVNYFRMSYFGLPSELNEHVFVIYDLGDSGVAYALTSAYNTTALDTVLESSIKIKLHGVDAAGVDIIQCAELDVSGRVTDGNYHYGGILGLNEYTSGAGASTPYFCGIRGEVVFAPGATGAVALTSPLNLLLF